MLNTLSIQYIFFCFSSIFQEVCCEYFNNNKNKKNVNCLSILTPYSSINLHKVLVI